MNYTLFIILKIFKDSFKSIVSLFRKPITYVILVLAETLMFLVIGSIAFFRGQQISPILFILFSFITFFLLIWVYIVNGTFKEDWDRYRKEKIDETIKK